jgi:uncharacterized protein YlaI
MTKPTQEDEIRNKALNCFLCDHCGSINTKEITREPVTVGRLTDHKITYHCNACGKETVKGDVKE